MVLSFEKSYCSEMQKGASSVFSYTSLHHSASFLADPTSLSEKKNNPVEVPNDVVPWDLTEAWEATEIQKCTVKSR